MCNLHVLSGTHVLEVVRRIAALYLLKCHTKFLLGFPYSEFAAIPTEVQHQILREIQGFPYFFYFECDMSCGELFVSRTSKA